MKKLILALLSFALIMASARDAAAMDYEKYLQSVTKNLKDSGMAVDAFNSNPFQTGTALSGYYLQEKTLLLERDAFFQLQSNKLKTTDDIADAQHRLKVLRAHANNLLLQLTDAVGQRNKEGFLKLEKPQEQADLDKIIADCNKDTDCVAARLQKPETNVYNVLIDNFALSSQIFTTIPHMQVLEVNAIYQLVQLLYLEVFYQQNRIAGIEFDLFREKQNALAKAVSKSRTMSADEKKLQLVLTENTLGKWKERILERKFDHKDEFTKMAADLRAKNVELLKELRDQRAAKPAVLGDVDQESRCLTIINFSDHRRCKYRKKLNETINILEDAKASLFLDEKSRKLPKSFWDDISEDAS